MDMHSIDTPALLIDREKTIRNIKRMEKRAASLNTRLRPHGKTAKSIDVMRLFSGIPECGITVSTLKEAEYYASHGITDIIYAVGIAPSKFDRVFRLLKKGVRLTVILDSLAQAGAAVEAAEHWKTMLPALIELSSDGLRSGLNPADPMLLHVAKYLEAADWIEFRGVITHAGGSYSCRTSDGIRKTAEQERSTAAGAAEQLRQFGVPCPVVSIGSTPTIMSAPSAEGITEYRAGAGIFHDLVMAGLHVCSLDDIAVSVLTTVIGRQKEKNRIIVDAGWTALSRDRSTAEQAVDQGYGIVCDTSGLPVNGLILSETSQEHGIITHRKGTPLYMERFPIGRRLRILPNHACATASCFDSYLILNAEGEITDQWESFSGWV